MTSRRADGWRSLAGIAALALIAGPISCTSPPQADSLQRLVLVLLVDQLRGDRLSAQLPGGLGRLLREGRDFSAAALGHAETTTCAGHASILTGRHPGPAGITGNMFVPRGALRAVYCVADTAKSATVIGGTAGRSPRNLDATTLGDWMKRARPETRVFAVSGKDRAAIMLAGQHADAAYWFDWRSGHFTTSGYYRDELPEWVTRWRPKAVPRQWEHASGDPPNGARPDDYAAEDSRFSRTSPHPLAFLSQLQASPYADDLTLEFALALAKAERLGRGAGSDLLAVSLSATDAIGHLYGPESQESLAALQHLDEALSSFLRELERRVGRGRLLVVLTSDHGVLPLPEWLSERGQSQCPVPGGRPSWQKLQSGLEQVLRERFGTPTGNPGWLIPAEMRWTVNRALAEQRGVAVEEIIRVARDRLRAHPGIAHVWSASEIESGALPAPLRSLYRNSHHPTRGGDLVVQPRRDCLFSPLDHGTSHGSPYAYDRNIPLVFFGATIEPGVVPVPAATVDIAPTLATLLGVSLPKNLDGRVLPLRTVPDDAH